MATVKRLADGKKLIIAKGLASKVMDTSSGGQDFCLRSHIRRGCKRLRLRILGRRCASLLEDSGALQWRCEECKEEGFVAMVQKKDQAGAVATTSQDVVCSEQS